MKLGDDITPLDLLGVGTPDGDICGCQITVWWRHGEKEFTSSARIVHVVDSDPLILQFIS